MKNYLFRLALCFVIAVSFFVSNISAQDEQYKISVQRFQQSRERFLKTPKESPLKSKAIKNFAGLRFFDINQSYRVAAKFTPAADQTPFEMPTFFNNGTVKHIKRGTVTFTLNGAEHTLGVYQRAPQTDGKNIITSSYAFVPFKDLTNGAETYGGGRYIDLSKNPAANTTLDFNLAYTPDCAFNEKFVCPAVPAENSLNTRVEAGEKVYSENSATAAKVKEEKVETVTVKETVKTEATPVAPRQTQEPKTLNASANGRFANFDNNRVFYQSYGKGDEALILVHGWTGNSEVWRGSVNAFPNTRVIALDLPGHGQSDKPQTNYTMEYFARSIDAVMKDAKVKRAVLVGHSMGTPVVRQFYRLYPEKTLGLVIVDGALRMFASQEETNKFFEPMKKDFKGFYAQFMGAMLKDIKDEQVKQFLQTPNTTPDYVAISAMDGMNDEKLYAADKINVPVLAVMAPSPYWKADNETFYRSVAPNLDYRMWQGVTHFLMMEKPQEFNQAVRFYLNKNQLLQN
jgi:uncharacterized protein (DUF1684 family)/pimeloyl-ACP methyl ester carboxylesterase